jgi:hypothetical protein
VELSSEVFTSVSIIAVFWDAASLASKRGTIVQEECGASIFRVEGKYTE